MAAGAAPPFKLGGSRYDQTTYSGRLFQICEMIDPRTLLTSDAKLRQSQELLRRYQEGGNVLSEGADDAAMWEAQRVVSAIIHAPTGEPMFLPGRMSAFVPMNVPVAAGMLMHGPRSVGANIFWQWLNQTYNCVNNYVNRAGQDVDWAPLMQSYGMAVGASVSIAVLAGRLMKARPRLAALGPFVPYLAVIIAGTCNVSFTRMDEVCSGIEVSDAGGRSLGRSVAAGRLAVFNTVTTRSMFLPIFPLLLPPLVMRSATVAGLVAPRSSRSVALELATIAACMSFALPCALAIQPQIMEIDVARLEPEFQGLVDAAGRPIRTVFASKGL